MTRKSLDILQNIRKTYLNCHQSEASIEFNKKDWTFYHILNSLILVKETGRMTMQKQLLK